MRAQVDTTFSHTNNSSRMELLKVFIGAGIIAQCTARKESKILHCVPDLYYFLSRPTHCCILLLLRGWTQALVLQAALSLYKKKERPTHNKVSYTEKHFTNRGSRWYSPLQQVLFFLPLIDIFVISSK